MIDNTVVADDGHQIEVFIWPNKRAKAWVHILHGMAEHALRYHEFAEKLVAAGYGVVAHNHRGHGAGQTASLGIFADSNGWEKILQDTALVRKTVCINDLPYFIIGHSMGSFIAQSYLTQHSKIAKPDISGVILSGSNLQSVLLLSIASVVAKIECFRVGKQNSSALLQFLSFGSFNKKFKPNRTQYDWLSRDGAEVDRYITDPLCGFDCSTGLWLDFLTGLKKLFKPANFKKIAPDLPIFIFGGSDDPVGLMGKGLPKLFNAYKANGHTNITLKLFHNGRHEMLNEINKEEVYHEIILWLEKQTCLN